MFNEENVRIYMQKRGARLIILYPSEIISINDFVPWGMLKPLNLLITCGKQVQADLQVQFTNSEAPLLPASCIHILNAKLQRTKIIMRMWEPGRQDIRDLFLTC